MSTIPADQLDRPGGSGWTREHLLGLEDLSSGEITAILDQAAEFKKCSLESNTKLDLLSGTVVANLFFEPSTRTRTSFNLAARRIGAEAACEVAGAWQTAQWVE